MITEWIDGERLDRSNAEDLTRSCSIAMNTYLTMMLETGVLHCDPHPGNLFRTSDGRLCILDWGLVTTLSPDLQLTFIEHVAHLTSRDYKKVPEDLVKLGFIPAGYEEVALEAGVVEVLSDVYTSFAGGGGAAKIDVNAVIGKLTGLQDTYGNIFQIPPYFAYIAKAFGVLEGIGLASNPDYAIVGECLPYVSQKLLTDTNPRTGEALKNFIFGSQGNKFDRVIDVKRLELLIDGYSSYSTTASSMNGTTSQKNRDIIHTQSSVSGLSVEKLNFYSDQIIALLLDSNGDGISSSSLANRTPLQKLIIEEISKIIGASSRLLWSNLSSRSGFLPTGRRCVYCTIIGKLVKNKR